MGGGNIVAGIDEAGRGPVIGPMVIAIVVMDEEEIVAYPVADSKLLTPVKREKIFSMLPDTCKRWIAVSAKEINRYMTEGFSLNEIEAIHMSKLINKTATENSVNVYYVDCVGRYPESFKKTLQKYTDKKVVPVIKGDRDIPIISAASIVAKVIRDRIISRIAAVIGDFGSGYPSDPRTRAFLVANFSRILHLEGYVRMHWKTLRSIHPLERDFNNERAMQSLLPPHQ
ncbi:MAG: ribonuclease HII [Candidatus Korarchaeota archaeon]